MPADAYRLALLFMENSEYAGISIRSHSFYAEILDVSRPRISHLITLLERTGILRRLGGRSVMVNPTFCWRGTAEEQSTAIARWDSIPQSVRPYLAKRSAWDRPAARLPSAPISPTTSPSRPVPHPIAR